jgi:eukaryotic-like serine/threonine-protein kinase
MLNAREPIAVPQALDIAAQVADGLQYAHEHQVIHRDIKPGNIMVLADGAVKITDFGIARMRNNEVKTMTGMILGSPKYMSPEQVAGKRADTRSDIFSLGVVLYEMLTGTSPFVADNIHGVMYQTLNFNPPAPKTLNPALPDVMNFIIAKALAKNLDDRYQQAKDLANDLREARAAVLGEAVDPALLAAKALAPQPFMGTSPPLTRQEDRRAALTGIRNDAPESADAEDDADTTDKGDTSAPALGLSKAFDSFDATMRLAALTGVEKDLDEFSETQKIARLKSLSQAKRGETASKMSDSATWQNESAAARMDAKSSEPSGTGSLRYVWIGSVALAAAAFLLLVLR